MVHVHDIFSHCALVVYEVSGTKSNFTMSEIL